jgi:hypothetical protein
LIHFLKFTVMKENRREQNLENERHERGTYGSDRADNQGREQNVSLGKDEKSSTMGRNTKNSGISTKDGLTGSDYDGQVTDGR